MGAFSYEEAFQRNLGWITETEQNILRHKRVAIAGLGGVGGSYLLALTRLGIENFKISDLDSFELSNFNRQVGASLSTLGQEKIKVMEAAARDINPQLKLEVYSSGLNGKNYEAFLNNCDLFLDSLDLYALPLKMKMFNECHRRGIPIITAAPIGMSVSLLTFLPTSMSPESYFGIPAEAPIEEQIVRFLVGVSPTMTALKNLIKEDGVSLRGRKLPSLPMGIELCTAVAASTALKILLGRGPVVEAPRSTHFDAFENTFSTTYRPLGHRNPLQWLVQRALLKAYLK
jgi:molybdopterin/thiamine biosynthesis adenylyltransferase